MTAYFIEYQDYSVEVPTGTTVVGRDLRCTLRFNDPAISRQHLQIIREDDQIFVEDLGSMNGTFVSGQKIEGKVALAHLDTIVLGDRTLRLYIARSEEDGTTTRKITSFASLGEVEIRAEHRSASAHASHQRCPRCGAKVTVEEPSCASCGYRWGNFRPRRATIEPQDRRRDERHAVEIGLIYTSSELEIEATTRDLSRSGVFVCSQVLEPIGTTCELTLLVDGGPPLKIQGVVRRVVEHEHPGDEPVGLGIEFLVVGEAEGKWLDIALLHLRHTAAFPRLP